MLTGFNTDIEHHGQVFHVQTQDKGTHDAVVETMVYLGGRILASVSTPYADLASAADLDQELAERMKAQHLNLINKILSGRFGEAPDRDLSELVLDFLEKEIDDAGPQPVAGDPLPDIETRKHRLQTILERLEEQIAREALQIPEPVATVRRNRLSGWIYGAGVGLLLVGAVAFAPTIGRLPGLDGGPAVTRALEPARPMVEPVAATPAPAEAPAEEAGRESSPPELFAAGPAAPNLTPTTAPVEVALETPPPLPPVLPAEPEPKPDEIPAAEPEKRVADAVVDTPPQALRRELPAYTRRASRQGHEGVVSLDLLIDEKGYVTQVKVLDKIPDSDLHEAAMDAATSWRFTPARRAGHDVKVWTTVDLEFSIWPDQTEVVRIRE